MKTRYLFWPLAFLLSPALNAQTCKPESIPATTPTSRFIIKTNGTVTDKDTGLMWKRCSEGLSGEDCATGSPTPYKWQQALQHAQAVNSVGFAGHKDWRLPNIQELRTLVEEQCDFPVINLDVFPISFTSKTSGYWSSSPVADSSYGAWVVSFSYGFDGWYDKRNYHSVRLVRSGR